MGNFQKIKGASAITWVSFPVLPQGIQWKPIKDGLIPNDLIIKLRVDNPYGESRFYNPEREMDCNTSGDHPVYEFGFEYTSIVQKDMSDLQNISVFPNPISRLMGQSTFNLINLPENASVFLTDIKGNVVRSFNSSQGIRSDYPGPGATVTEFNIINPNTLYCGLYFITVVNNVSKKKKTLKWMIL